NSGASRAYARALGRRRDRPASSAPIRSRSRRFGSASPQVAGSDESRLCSGPRSRARAAREGRGRARPAGPARSRATGPATRAAPRKPAAPSRASSPVAGPSNSADGETLVAAGILPGDLDVVDASPGGATAAPAHHRLDLLARPLEDGLDRPLGSVRHPACDPERARAPSSLLAEEHALDKAAHDHAGAHEVLSRQTPPRRRAARSGTGRSGGRPVARGRGRSPGAPARVRFPPGGRYQRAA